METFSGKVEIAGRCCHCRKRLDGATGVNSNGHGPRPGDLSICLYCSTVQFYNADMSFRLPTTDEAAELATNEEVQKALIVIAMMHLQNPAKFKFNPENN